MEIVDLCEKWVPLYLVCLEDWSEEIRESGDHKCRWYEKMKGRGLRVKLALDDQEQVGGMIQYLPVEESFVEGEGLFHILCIWVHGHKQGRGNFQRRGMGRALLEAAEADAKASGAKGMSAWGVALPFWMKASWFRKHGYQRADRMGIASLVWKPFGHDAAPPRWVRPRKNPEGFPGQVTVKALVNGWCPAMNMVFERARRAAEELGEVEAYRGKVVFEGLDSGDTEVFDEWGIADGLFVDGKKVSTGPPPSYEKVKKKIERQLRRLGKKAD